MLRGIFIFLQLIIVIIHKYVTRNFNKLPTLPTSPTLPTLPTLPNFVNLRVNSLVGVCWRLLASVGVCWRLLASIGVCWRLLACWRFCQLAFLALGPHYTISPPMTLLNETRLTPPRHPSTFPINKIGGNMKFRVDRGGHMKYPLRSDIGHLKF